MYTVLLDQGSWSDFEDVIILLQLMTLRLRAHTVTCYLLLLTGERLWEISDFSVHQDSLFILKMRLNRFVNEKIESITKRLHVILETTVLKNLCTPSHQYIRNADAHKLGLTLILSLLQTVQ